MQMPVNFIPAPPRRSGPPKRGGGAAIVPAIPPTLVSADYAVAASVTLTFDRAVDAGAMDVASVVVNDGEIENYVYAGASVEAISPTSVRVTLTAIQDFADAGCWVTVPPGNGVVSVDGGAMWAGVTAFALPFE